MGDGRQELDGDCFLFKGDFSLSQPPEKQGSEDDGMTLLGSSLLGVGTTKQNPLIDFSCGVATDEVPVHPMGCGSRTFLDRPSIVQKLEL